MSIPFNPVTVSIGKDSLSSFKSLHISQRTGAHHSFKLSLDLETGGNRYVHNIGRSSEWLGQTIVVRAANRTMFLGIVTDVRLHREGSDFGCIVVQGYSVTYRLETAPGCYSWNDYTIEETVRELCGRANVEVRLNASYRERLDYICRYDESEFDFIRRLALQYQEWMYYDGTALVFGRPKGSQNETVLEYGTTLSTLEIGLQTLARPEQVFSYHSSSDREMDRPTPDLAYGHDHMAGKAFRASLGMYGTPARQHALPRIRTESELIAYTRRKQAAETAETHYIIGESEVPELRVGSVVRLFSSFLERVGELTKDSLGDFIITEIEHDVSEGSYYHNRFKAIPSTVEALPSPDVRLPQAETQMATVISNNDPSNSGRVQVRMNWQTGHMRTGWVRVMTPDGGSSKEVSSNRGFVFIPEVGDQVLLGFRHGDPARPYVMGSLFNGSTGKGGGHSNSIKSITTRSGISVTLNDDNKSLHIKDAGGSSILLDGKGNIILKAPKNIHIHAGNDMCFMAGDNLNVNVGNSQTTNIGNMQLTNVMQKILVNTPFMQQLVSEFFHTQAGKALLNSQNQIKIEAPETNVVGEQKLFMHSAEKAVVNSQGTMEIRGEQGMSELNDAIRYNTIDPKLDSDTVVFFRPSQGYKGEFGFDWYREGNSGISGDFAFENKDKDGDKGIIGRHYIINEKGEKKTADYVYKDKDKKFHYSLFETMQSSIDHQRRCYERRMIPWLKTDENNERYHTYTYFTPIMTIMKGVSAKLNAVIKFNPQKEDRPKEIKLEFGTGSKGLSVSPSTLPIKEGEIPITIMCSGEFDKEQVLLVKADDKECGKIKILPNGKQHQKEIKVVTITIRTRLEKSRGSKLGRIFTGGPELFVNTLRQALVTVLKGVESIEELDCTGEEFTKAYKETFPNRNGEIQYGINHDTAGQMKLTLEQTLQEKYGHTYDDYYKLFFFADPCNGINGYAFYDSRHACFFDGHNASTVGHEVYHCFGLAHTFDFRDPKRCEIGYKYTNTNNMLDYSHHAGIDRNSLFYWQWKFINPYILSGKPRTVIKDKHKQGMLKPSSTGGRRKEDSDNGF